MSSDNTTKFTPYDIIGQAIAKGADAGAGTGTGVGAGAGAGTGAGTGTGAGAHCAPLHRVYEYMRVYDFRRKVRSYLCRKILSI